ncbi:YigZ family protein [Lapidilactobacillus luobeiensis]|uniref:YigZ family protein n=1 Tax=Lapidilactobacillus luobeiensis TaxID=2950371 RepID=UPI0021C2CCB2|nr:YigZ family protein [Lapidilactobacillus luobeiensis]
MNRYAKELILIETYRTIAQNASAELLIKKSRFIGQVFRVETEQAAQTALATVRQQHNKASHHCFAYQLGLANEIQRMSDDGEPSGTAGSPILNVLQQERLNNVLCVVTRYFGGIKLGAGGLIRAYGQATSAALNTAGLVQGIEQRSFKLTFAYSELDFLQNQLRQQKIAVTASEYGTAVSLTIWLDQATATVQLTQIKNWLRGQVTITELASAFREVRLTE